MTKEKYISENVKERSLAMNKHKTMTIEGCLNLTPRMFAVNHDAGEKLAPEILAWLDPVNAGSFHRWELGKEKATELHYHDSDEYWIWSKGRTQLTIRLPDGRSDSFEIGPGWIVYCVRGVEHGHTPIEDWSCFECVSVTREDAKSGHLYRRCDGQ